MAPRAGPTPRRGTELALLAFALVVVVLAYVAVGLATSDRLPVDLLRNAGTLAVVLIGAHLAVRRFAPYADPLVLPCVALLNGLGLVMVHRLDLAYALQASQAGRTVPGNDAPLQVAWSVIGIGLFVAVLVLVRDHAVLARYAYTCAALGLLLLLLPNAPLVGRSVNGERLWVRVGPVQVQPSEIAKLALLVFFASYLVAKRDVLSLVSRRVLGLQLPRARDLGPVLLAWAASLLALVLENDLGSSLLFFGIFVAMLYMATQRVSWLFIGLLLFAAGAYTASLLFSHVQERVDIWLHPFAHPDSTGYQLVQSLFGFGTGGLTGTGLGQGSPETVPFAKTDFILASFGEELGLVGVFAILLLFGLVVERGLRAAVGCRDPFGKLLAGGLAFALALQVFVIAGGVTGLIPLTGVTLPWLSYGGSSVVSNWVLVAVLLRISDAARRPTPSPVSPGSVRAALEDAPTTVVRR